MLSTFDCYHIQIKRVGRTDVIIRSSLATRVVRSKIPLKGKSARQTKIIPSSVILEKNNAKCVIQKIILNKHLNH